MPHVSQQLNYYILIPPFFLGIAYVVVSQKVCRLGVNQTQHCLASEKLLHRVCGTHASTVSQVCVRYF